MQHEISAKIAQEIIERITPNVAVSLPNLLLPKPSNLEIMVFTPTPVPMARALIKSCMGKRTDSAARPSVENFPI